MKRSWKKQHGRKIATAAMAAVSTLAISFLVVIGAQAGGEASYRSDPVAGKGDPVGGPTQKQIESFERLGDAEEERDQPANDLTSFVNLTSATTKMGLNFALAREVLSVEGSTLYLAPARDSLCIVFDPADRPENGGAMVGCNGDRAASTNGLILSTFDPETGVSFVAGALPSSVEDVSVDAFGPWKMLAESRSGFILKGQVASVELRSEESKNIVGLPGRAGLMSGSSGDAN